MAEDLEDVKANIRAIIVSSKTKIPIKTLLYEYETLCQCKLPYRSFKYEDPESFLRSIPTLTVTGSGLNALVGAASNSASSHITDMIAKQKSTKKRSSGPPPRRGRGGYHPSRGSTRGRGGYRPPSWVLKENYSYASKENFNYTSRENSNYLSREDSTYDSRERSSYPSRENSAPRRYSPGNEEDYNPPRRYFPANEAEYNPLRREVGDNVSSSTLKTTSLVVKVDNDKRQVSIGETSQSHPKRYELPPRLQKQKVEWQKSSSSQMEIPEGIMYSDYSNINSLTESAEQLNIVEEDEQNSATSRLGPSQLIAEGLARQQALNNMLLEPEESNLLMQEALPAAAAQYDPVSIDDYNFNIPTPVPKPDEADIRRNVVLLLQYAKRRGWEEPEYKPVPRKPKGQRTIYGASLKIIENGQIIKKLSCYPFEDYDVDVAKGYAAKMALEELLVEEKVKDKNTNKIISSKNKILIRVSSILEGMVHGMFSNKVEETYTEKYEERLPEDWLDYIRSCPSLSVDQGPKGFIVVPQAEPKVPLIDLNNIKPNEGVHITVPASTTSVWFQIVGPDFNELFYDLAKEMNDYYKNIGCNDFALTIEADKYYAVKDKDNWFRARAITVKENEKLVECSMIDYGDVDTFGYSNVYRLPIQFRTLPSQALQCCLDGLEELDGISDDSTHIRELQERTLIAEVKDIDKENRILKVVLFDTSDENEDVNVNEALLNDIVLTYYPKPVLAKKDCAINATISSISKKGEVYVQVPSVAYNLIEQVLLNMDDLEINMYKMRNFRQAADLPLDTKLLAKYSKDNGWYRAVLAKPPSPQQNKVTVQFIDFGNTETVGITEIAEFNRKKYRFLNELPAQTIKVALNNLPVESLQNYEIAKLHYLLLDKEKDVLVKTVSLQDGVPPVVEIFFKSEDDSLKSVSNIILMDRPKENSSNDLNHKVNRSNGLNLKSQELKCPGLNEDWIEIKIILAASPGNFTFQPMINDLDLEVMMEKLQVYYEAGSFPELSKDDIVEGSVYAGKYDDDLWYRLKVTQNVDIGSTIPVRFCDYGDVAIIPISSLRELQSEFRELPFMAVKGKLAGVVPAHMDWSVQDCLRFDELTGNKYYISAKVVGIKENFNDPMETVFELKLVDTTTDKDQDIANTLVEECRAMKLNV